MKNSIKTTIKIDKNRIIKILPNISFINTKMYSLVEDIDKYIFIEYNVFSKDGNYFSKEGGTLNSFCKEVSVKLDEANPTLFDKLYVRFFGIVAVLLFVVYQVYNRVDDVDTIVSIVQSYIPNTAVQIILSCFLIGFLIYFLLTEHGKYYLTNSIPNFSIFKNNLYSRQLKKLEGSFSTEDFLKISKKWFKKNKNYLFIIHFPNWAEFNPNGDIKQLIIELLKRHPNTKLIYTHEVEGEDKYQNGLKRLGLAIDEIYFNEIDEKIEEIYQEVYRLKLKFPEITIIDLEKIKLKKLNEIEVYLLYNLMTETLKNKTSDAVLELRDKIKNLNLAFEDESELVSMKKNEKSEEKIFKSKTDWEKLDDIFQKIYLLVLFYCYYFQKPIEQNKATQLSLIFKKSSILRKFNIKPQQMLEEFFSNNSPALKEEIENFNEIDHFDSFSDGIIKFRPETREYYIQDEDYKFINRIINNEDLIKKFKLSNYDSEFSKYFLLLILKKNSYFEYEEIFNKLLLYIKPEDRKFFQLYASTSLLKIPYQEDDNIGRKYEKGISFAKEAWLIANGNNLNKGFSIVIFDINIDLVSDLLIDPLFSALELLKYSIDKSSKNEIENLLEICELLMHSDELSLKYKDIHESFCQEFECEKIRYLFYIDKCDPSQLFKVPYLSMIYEIEKNVFILLPRIEQNQINDLPHVRCESFEQSNNNHPELIFLLILSYLHNSYLFLLSHNNLSLEKNEYSNELDNKISDLFRLYEDSLEFFSKKQLNYRDYNYYMLYKAKGSLLFDLLFQLDILKKSRYYDAIHRDSFLPKVFSLFESFENSFLIVDLLFWKIWFDARTSNVVKADIYSLIDIIEKKLHYIHYDNGLIYISVISNTVMPPLKTYTLVSTFLKSGDKIPSFIELTMLINFLVTIFNGKFKEKSERYQECLQIIDTVEKKFKNIISEASKNDVNFLKFQILISNPKDFKEEALNELIQSLEDGVGSMDDSQKGEFYFSYLNYLLLKKDVTKIIQLDLFENTKKYLQNYNRFHYIQFLIDSITGKFDIIFEKTIEDQIVAFKNQVSEYKDKISSPISDVYGLDRTEGFRADLQEEASRIESKREEINKVIRKDALYDELEKEFNAYYQFYKEYLSEDQPHKYLFASTALFLAKYRHSRFRVTDPDSVRYYKIALQLYYELQEYVKFLEVGLELKFLKWAINDLNLKEMVFELLQYYYSDSLFIIKDNQNKLANLLYDFLNNHNFDSREDYSFNTLLNKRIDDPDSSKKDRDSRGIRLYLTNFYINYHKGDRNKLDKDLLRALEYAKINIEKVTYDDMLHIEECYKKACSVSDSVDWLENMNRCLEEFEKIRHSRGSMMIHLLREYDPSNNSSPIFKT